MADSGCRPLQIRGLKVEDCFSDSSIWLVENKSKGRTGVIERPIYLRREVAELTRKLIGIRTEGRLFWDRDAETWTTGTLWLPLARLGEGDQGIRLVV